MWAGDCFVAPKCLSVLSLLMSVLAPRVSDRALRASLFTGVRAAAVEAGLCNPLRFVAPKLPCRT